MFFNRLTALVFNVISTWIIFCNQTENIHTALRFILHDTVKRTVGAGVTDWRGMVRLRSGWNGMFDVIGLHALIALNHNPLACMTDIPEAPVISGLLAATEGQRITLNCTVRCHCPLTSPTLQWIWEQGSHWNDSEPEEDQMVLTDPYRPTLRSSLSFTATYQLKPRIKCEVRHPGFGALVTAKSLHITCEQRLDFANIHKFAPSDTFKCLSFFHPLVNSSFS